MELLYVKSKDPLTIESYVFDSTVDAAAYYTQHFNQQIFIGFFDEKDNHLLTLAQDESEVELYNKFIQDVINRDTRVTHLFQDSSFVL